MQLNRKKRTLLYSSRSALSQLFLASSDIISFCAAPLIAAFIISLFWDNLYAFIPKHEIDSRFTAHIALALLCISWFWVRLRHYTYRKPFWFELKEILRTILIFSVIDLAIIAFSKWQFSRYLWVITWCSVLILVPICRTLTKKVLNLFNLWDKQCVIIGTSKNAQEAYLALKSENNLGFNIQYFFSCVPLAQGKHYLHKKRIIDDENVLWRTTDPRNTQYILALDDGEGNLRAHWLKQLAMRQARSVSVVPTIRGLPLNSTDMSFFFRHEVLLLRINNNLSKKSARLIKRSFDLFISGLIFLILSPIMLVLALLVMRDGGSPIYGHTRIGKDGKPFQCLKFRSMIKNSQEVLDQLLATDPAAKAEWDKDFKLKNDPRITGVGHFLRKSSLDELPQLLNVLAGQMSLVGPRPVISEELERYGENKEYYLMAKPGMTGLWQVSGRNDVDYETRVYFDAWYVKNWSLWNDIAIMFKTVNVVLKRDGAY